MRQTPEGLGDVSEFQKRYLTEVKHDNRFRRKVRILESQCNKDNEQANLKYSLLVHRGRNAEGVGLAQTLGAGQYRRSDLLKLSKNVLFD
jgi:hypothetical protein